MPRVGAFLGAQAVDARVVKDSRFLFAAGVTAGIDGALSRAAELRGVEAAQRIQLQIAYAPEPPFQSDRPDQAPPAVLEAMRASMAERTARRTAAAEQYAAARGGRVRSRGYRPLRADQVKNAVAEV